MDNDTEAPIDPGVKDNQRYTEQDFEGNTRPRHNVSMAHLLSIQLDRSHSYQNVFSSFGFLH